MASIIVLVGNSAVLAEGASATTPIGELIPLGYVVTIIGAVWYLSAKMRGVEDSIRLLSDWNKRGDDRSAAFEKEARRRLDEVEHSLTSVRHRVDSMDTPISADDGNSK